MQECRPGLTYTYESGSLRNSGYNVFFQVPRGYSGELMLDHIFSLNSDDHKIECTLYLHKPGEILLRGWLEEPFKGGTETLMPVNLEQQHEHLQVMRFMSPSGVGLKIKLDQDGYGFGAIVVGPQEREADMRTLLHDLLDSVYLPKPQEPSGPKSKEATTPSSPEPHLNYAQCCSCAGTGRISCSSCGGQGYHLVSRTRTAWDGSTEYYEESVPCSCLGGQQSCYSCGGTGQVVEY